jgi:hypothetical protein
VGLLLECGDCLGRHDAQVYPGAEGRHVDALGTAEDQLADDLLGPGRAGLGPGRDDDVVVAEVESVPAGGIHVVVVDLAGLDGKSGHRNILGQNRQGGP